MSQPHATKQPWHVWLQQREADPIKSFLGVSSHNAQSVMAVFQTTSGQVLESTINDLRGLQFGLANIGVKTAHGVQYQKNQRMTPAQQDAYYTVTTAFDFVEDRQRAYKHKAEIPAFNADDQAKAQDMAQKEIARIMAKPAF